jgi:hypothetical protein
MAKRLSSKVIKFFYVIIHARNLNKRLENGAIKVRDIIFAFMNTKFYASTNWLPWLLIAFILSSIFLGLISEIWLLMTLIALSFLPMIIVRLTLNGYFLVDNFEVKYCYDRRAGRKISFSIPLSDIQSVQRLGKSVVINYDKGEVFNTRIHQSEAFMAELLKYNPEISLIKN